MEECNTLTRTAVTPVVETPKDPKAGVVTESTGEHTEMPPSLYREAGKTPYLLDLFNAPEVYKQFNLSPQIDEIDNFILSEIKRKGLDDTSDSYENILAELEKHTKVTESVYTEIDSLLEWVRIQSKLIEAAREKEEFLKKTPDEMNLTELKRHINGN